jgi:ATP-dependent Clp protease adapter protein ClpS
VNRTTVRCPVCGELLPCSESGAEKLNHLIYENGSGLCVVCPKRFAQVIV